VSMSTGRWSELSAEHEVRYTGNDRYFAITMSKTAGEAEGLYGLVVGVSGPKIRQEFSSAQSGRNFPPSRGQPRVTIHMFGVEVAGHQDRQSPAETDGQVRSD
jgi:hypothetical protein